jgi:hypothetical protein
MPVPRLLNLFMAVSRPSVSRHSTASAMLITAVCTLSAWLAAQSQPYPASRQVKVIVYYNQQL